MSHLKSIVLLGGESPRFMETTEGKRVLVVNGQDFIGSKKLDTYHMWVHPPVSEDIMLALASNFNNREPQTEIYAAQVSFPAEWTENRVGLIGVSFLNYKLKPEQ